MLALGVLQPTQPARDAAPLWGVSVEIPKPAFHPSRDTVQITSICKAFAVRKAAHDHYYSTLSQKIPPNTIFLHLSKNRKKKTTLRLGQVLAVWVGFALKTPDLTLLCLATLEPGLE